MKDLHPEEAYEILSKTLVTEAEKYGVDITDNHLGEFLSDLYDQCYHCLHKNIKEDDL